MVFLLAAVSCLTTPEDMAARFASRSRSILRPMESPLSKGQIPISAGRRYPLGKKVVQVFLLVARKSVEEVPEKFLTRRLGVTVITRSRGIA